MTEFEKKEEKNVQIPETSKTEKNMQVPEAAKTESGERQGEQTSEKEKFVLSETWAQDGKQELLDWIEEQGIYIRE